MVLKGVEILIYFIVIGWESIDIDDEKKCQFNVWIIFQCVYVVVNGFLVILVNCVGYEFDLLGQINGILFWGNSFVVGLQGEYLVQVGNDCFENMIVEVDFECLENVCCWWLFFCDWRIDEYGNLIKCFID